MLLMLESYIRQKLNTRKIRLKRPNDYILRIMT